MTMTLASSTLQIRRHEYSHINHICRHMYFAVGLNPEPRHGNQTRTRGYPSESNSI
ncbi:hypothetical protein MTR_3g069820 [Medicago truncatula]|uniref:Uncharacterized protein n=1 Tax=Medicago truncatula TaxID=3880 RepID=G7JAL2_MEDTR|nr:hypothetical protein MTR_3g069820 [Medicago truncatula]